VAIRPGGREEAFFHEGGREGLGASGTTMGTTFLELFVHSTLWMSFSLASLVPFVQLQCGAPLDWRPFWAGFAESLAVYTLDHKRDLQRLAPAQVNSRRGLARHRGTTLTVLMFLGLFSFIGSVIAAGSWRVTATFGAHLLLCFSYAKLKPRLPYMKAAYVSICVMFMAIAAPAAYTPGLLSSLGIAAFLKIMSLIFCVSFTIENLQDLRDIDEDKKTGVVTIPSGLGAAMAVRVLLGVQGLCAVLHCGLSYLGALPLRPELLSVHVLCALSTLCVLWLGARAPLSFFKVVLEPLYAAPLLAIFVRLALGA